MSNIFYIDNVNINRSNSTIIGGNVVTDIYSSTLAEGIHAELIPTLILRDNKVARIRSLAESAGIDCNYCDTVNGSFNTISRAGSGLILQNSNYSEIYNLTIHECYTCVNTSANGVFRNIVFSEYEQYKNYSKANGFIIQTGTTIDVDYIIHYGLSGLFTSYGTGTYTLGDEEYNQKPIFIDEAQDDLTPDHIDFMVKSGIDEPRLYEDPSIGGIQSKITDEITADKKYYLDLLDNSFWDIENLQSGEISLIKAFNSRILAACELADFQIERDYYIKFCSSLDGFTELYPMHSRYHTPSRAKKNAMDMWMGGQNACTLPSYNRGIGGYNLLPSFFKRALSYDDGWIIDVSYVDYDNYLLGADMMKYGIIIDVLGISTLTQEASAECYTNVMNTIADIAPVYWHLHKEVQPPNYITFADFYNNFEYCELDNMIYNEDYHISIYEVQQDGSILTPLITVTGFAASGSPSGAVELSTFDRINSEIVDRTMYYRIGNDSSSMTSWQTIEHPIGEILYLDDKIYVQFKIDVSNVLRQIDYEFVGLAMRLTTETSFVSGSPLGDYWPQVEVI